MKNTIICLAVLVFLGLTMVDDTNGQALTAELRRQTINDLAALLPERYAYKEVGPRLQKLLEDNLKAGRYDKFSSPLEFSLAVTEDLRSLQPDRHLALNYSPEVPTTTTGQAKQPAPQPSTPEDRARRVSEFNRQMNFGYKEVKFLYGNIGYLKIDYFDAFLDYSRPVADASMAFFRNSDALIIDLRENGGGSGEMVNYLVGFFINERVHAGSSYNRLTDSTTEEYIDPQPKEKRLGPLPIYVLTSANTVSAAEALAYHLKYLCGAIIIGDTSAGAANPGRVTRLNSLFTAFIPNRHGIHAVTKTNWEGTGVPVDLSVSADDALPTAKLRALKDLRDKTKDPQQKAKFTSYVTYLEMTKRERSLTPKEVREYRGDYEGKRIIIEKDGRLFYDHLGEAGGEMHLTAPDVFMVSEGDTTISFVRDRNRKVVGITVQWALTKDVVTAARLRD